MARSNFEVREVRRPYPANCLRPDTVEGSVRCPWVHAQDRKFGRVNTAGKDFQLSQVLSAGLIVTALEMNYLLILPQLEHRRMNEPVSPLIVVLVFLHVFIRLLPPP